MLTRKIVTAIITFLVSSLIISNTSSLESLLNTSSDNETGTFIDNFLFVSIYVGGGVFLYGLPLSIVIELITRNTRAARFALSFPLHILIGIIPFVVLGFLAIFSLLVSIVFLVIDEVLRYITKGNKWTLMIKCHKIDKISLR